MPKGNQYLNVTKSEMQNAANPSDYVWGEGISQFMPDFNLDDDIEECLSFYPAGHNETNESGSNIENYSPNNQGQVNNSVSAPHIATPENSNNSSNNNILPNIDYIAMLAANQKSLLPTHFTSQEQRGNLIKFNVAAGFCTTKKPVTSWENFAREISEEGPNKNNGKVATGRGNIF